MGEDGTDWLNLQYMMCAQMNNLDQQDTKARNDMLDSQDIKELDDLLESIENHDEYYSEIFDTIMSVWKRRELESTGILRGRTRSMHLNGSRVFSSTEDVRRKGCLSEQSRRNCEGKVRRNNFKQLENAANTIEEEPEDKTE